MSEEKAEVTVAQAESQEAAPALQKKRSKKLPIIGAIVAVLVVAGVGMMVWHESPSFCSTLCHIEGTYVDNYMQEQGVPGIDKYGNKVSNTNAMMAVLHRSTKATAKPEIVCVDCHVPNIAELAHDGVSFVSGNYLMPRDERSASGLMSWDGKAGEDFCANPNCHVYLLGEGATLDYDKLEASTKGLAFNPHERHHEALSLECTDCHKGHRASIVVCTGCHEHENVAIPDGWMTYAAAEIQMKLTFPGPLAQEA